MDALAGRLRLRLVIALASAVAAVVLAPPTAVAAAPAPAPAATATATQQALDKLVAEGVPGAIALERHDGVTARTAAGVRDLKTKQPIRATDRVRVGSITKSAVATVVLQLAAERRLSLDDSVERWLPGLVPGGQGITVRQLMQHTSGIYDYLDLPFYVPLLHDPLRTRVPRELVAQAVAHPPLFAPGTSWSYSNTNYVLLGLVVAKVRGVPAALEMAAPALEVYRRVIVPQRLSHTSFPVTNPDILGPHAHGYLIGAPPEWGFAPVLDTTRLNPSYVWTAGAIVSTLDDVASFHRALFTGRLLEPEQQRELQTTVPVAEALQYGLGVMLMQTPCGPAWGHNGAMPTAVSYALTSPDGKRQAVLVATSDRNAWSAQLDVDYTVALFTAYCGKPVPAPAARPAAARLAASGRSLDRVR